MQKRIAWGRVLLIAGLTTACWFSCGAMLQIALFKNCPLGGCAPPRAFRVIDLSLPLDLFPPGAVLDGPLRPDRNESLPVLEDGHQWIFWNQRSAGARFGVYRFPSDWLASSRFSVELGVFTTAGVNTPWPRPPSLTFQSQRANEYYIGCGTFQTFMAPYHCAMLARYDEFVVSFSAQIDEAMPERRFEGVVVYIDEQFSQRLAP